MRNDILAQAYAIRESMNSAADVLTDEQAVNAKNIYFSWEKDTEYFVGDRRRALDGSGEIKLYKCRQEHTSQEIYPPYMIPAIWTVIDEKQEGTVDDPIPASRGMEYTYGLYYLDPEDGNVYLCQRGEETGSIVLQYLPHELIGQYFVTELE